MPVSYRAEVKDSKIEALPIASEFMTRKLVNLKPDMSVFDAIDLFIKHKISGACVVDEQNRLIGIYSEKDCLKELKNRFYYNQPSGLVKDHMANNPETITPDTDIIKVSDIFLYNPFKLIPVLDGKKLVGIVSRRDVIQVMKKFKKK